MEVTPATIKEELIGHHKQVYQKQRFVNKKGEGKQNLTREKADGKGKTGGRRERGTNR